MRHKALICILNLKIQDQMVWYKAGKVSLPPPPFFFNFYFLDIQLEL